MFKTAGPGGVSGRGFNGGASVQLPGPVDGGEGGPAQPRTLPAPPRGQQALSREGRGNHSQEPGAILKLITYMYCFFIN